MKSKMTRLGCVLKKMEMIDSDGEIKGKKTQDHENLCMIISVFFLNCAHIFYLQLIFKVWTTKLLQTKAVFLYSGTGKFY